MKMFIYLCLALFYAIGCKGQTKSTNEKREHMGTTDQQKEIYFAGGCFWGTEYFMQQIRGVETTQVGYANGRITEPTYEQVCSGRTGAAEAVKVIFCPHEVDLSLLLDLYFKTIDPTSLNRQGNDRGTQYRTGIYYTDSSDLPVIEKAVEKLAIEYARPLVIEIMPLVNFYPAEEYHQDYLDRNPGGYCHIDPTLFDVARKANQKPEKKEEETRQIGASRIYHRPDDSTLRTLLTPEQYAVTQKSATEPPFKNSYWDEQREGIYVDIITGEPLFVSTDKFDSGCGWPSFSKPIANHLLEERLDNSHGMRRTEVRSKTGNAHLGHLFTDGPKEKGGLRYCINSASLRFIPKDRMVAEGYGEYLKYIGE